MSGWLWFVGILGSLILLGAGVFYGVRRTSRPEGIETKIRRDEATKDIYRRADEADPGR